MTPESRLGRAVRAACNVLPGVVLWRNARGYDERARTEYGLADGASDYVGIASGVFLAIETKVKPRTASEKQLAFIAAVRRRGGVAGVAYSVEDALALVDEALDRSVGSRVAP